MSGYERFGLAGRDLSPPTINWWIVLGAVIVGVLVNLNALMVPLLGQIGGGIVAGFVAAYAAGRFFTGIVHAAIASALVGAAAGAVTALLGLTLGLFNEPPLLVFESIGPISPELSGYGLPTAVLIVLAFAGLTAVDGLVGGLIGGGLRTILPW